MILADDILASAGGRDDIYAFGGMSRMASALMTAQKFVLNRQAIGAVHSVSHSSPKSIMSARQFARAPFPTIWVEWRFQDVRAVMDDPPSINPGRYEPDRVGILIETVPNDPTAGMMTQCWTCEHGLQQSLLCQLYDMGDDDPDLDAVKDHFDLPFRIGCGDSPEKVRREVERQPEILSKSVQTHLRRDRSQMDHLVDELMRFDFAPNPRTINLLMAMQRSGDQIELFELVRDWEREALSALSTMILLNSRDLVDRKPVSQAKINKKRHARGKRLLFDHTVIGPGRGMGLPQGGTRSSSKAHVVRGHFKVRKGGVFWWNPHVRGDGKVRERAAYEMRV